MGATHELPDQACWVESLESYLKPYWSGITEGEWARNMREGLWSTEAMRSCMLHMYPFIHAFPKFLALILLKAEDDYTRNFLIDNIRVEKTHAELWMWMAEGFGVPREQLLAAANGEGTPLRDVQSLSDWLWHINSHGSLVEAMAATSFAIEGATGDMARALAPHFEAYGTRPGVDMNPRTLRWTRAHAMYDDEHPKIALGIVAKLARTDQDRLRVMRAAKRSLELLHLALLTGAQAGQHLPAGHFLGHDRRALDRRAMATPIPFPDRRSGDRRALGAVH
ncbi:MAG: iron-containing redox enzyme family protein [Pseudomonadota bacterium]|nr:iron-containing redox enzyme family protein [Pseudomonadota bacterium]